MATSNVKGVPPLPLPVSLTVSVGTPLPLGSEPAAAFIASLASTRRAVRAISARPVGV